MKMAAGHSVGKMTNSLGFGRRLIVHSFTTGSLRATLNGTRCPESSSRIQNTFKEKLKTRENQFWISLDKETDKLFFLETNLSKTGFLAILS